MNRDKLLMADPKAVSRGCMHILHAMQSLPADVQLLSVAVVFLLLSDHFEQRGADTFNIVRSILNDKQGGKRPEFRACQSYIQEELPK